MAARFLTAEQAAEHLGLTTQAVYQRVHRGTIPHVKWGRRVRFDIQALNKLMAEHTKEAA